MNIKDVLMLMDKFEGSSLTSFEVELQDTKVKFAKEKEIVAVSAPTQAVSAPRFATGAVDSVTDVAVVAADSGTYISSPIVGVFYAAPSPDEPTFVKVGDKVKKGQTVCIIEAMKMMNEIPAPYDCEIVRALAANGDLVEYSQQLFEIREF